MTLPLRTVQAAHSSSDTVVLAVDLGTSGCKTALVSLDGRVLAWAFRPVDLHLLPGHGAEQDPRDWWSAFVASAADVLAQQPALRDRVAAVCCSTQGEGTVAVDRNGEPLTRCLMWMDMRGASAIQQQSRGWVNVSGYGVLKLWRWVRLTGGAPALSGKDPAAHMLYVRKAMPAVYERTFKFLNVLDYMNLRLTGRFVATHDSILTSWVTDNRDLSRLRYDPALVAASGIDVDKFPELVRSSDVIGALLPQVASELGLPASTRVVAGAIDVSAAAIGSGAVEDYRAHLYIGTSSWLAAHLPRKQTSVSTQLAAVPCAQPDKYLMIGLQTAAGANLSFLRDRVLYNQDELLREACVPDVYKILDRIAASVPAGSRGLIYTPWLHGERCPVDDQHLRAGLFNLSLEHSREDIIRSFFEGVALNTRWMFEPVKRFVGQPIDALTLIGGGATSDVWCQIFADTLGVRIHQLAEPLQANALGAAYIAGVALGEMSFADVPRRTRMRASYEPISANRAVLDERFATFKDIYRRNRGLYRRLNASADHSSKGKA
jgi:xylulokinase